MSARAVKADLRALADPNRAAGAQSFFKTGPGEYGEGDQFLGITVPKQRKVARQYRSLPLAEVAVLLASPIHEDRFAALEILVMQYEAGDAKARTRVFRFYLQHTDRINNWDLVDTSARYIVGEHLRDRSRARVYHLARSTDVWERRIAMVATHAWIASGDTSDAYAIADLLLDDPHDLIRKAVGWMLREAGVHDRAALLRFLRTHYARVARTTLRYAIEHLSAPQRKRILTGDFA
ncbi:MAG: DNA alkylation repair protein [Vicinamibacterales bacterium]|nr:DNA alkylation repair protein [Vicinamibacterales bacterium]